MCMLVSSSSNNHKKTWKALSPPYGNAGPAGGRAAVACVINRGISNIIRDELNKE